MLYKLRFCKGKIFISNIRTLPFPQLHHLLLPNLPLIKGRPGRVRRKAWNETHNQGDRIYFTAVCKIHSVPGFLPQHHHQELNPKTVFSFAINTRATKIGSTFWRFIRLGSAASR